MSARTGARRVSCSRAAVDGIVPLGGTGEYGALARSERVRMPASLRPRVNGRVPVIAGVLDPGYHDALEAGRMLADAGVDALMVVTPYYTNPTQVRRARLLHALRRRIAGADRDLRDSVPNADRDCTGRCSHELSRHPKTSSG